jgi:uncharacterized damage-inducible protein DinB
MEALTLVRRLWTHAAWADELLLSALVVAGGEPAAAVREYAHVLGAEATWLARIEGRPSAAAVWPELSLVETRALADTVRAEYAACMARLTGDALDSMIDYRNSKGQAFSTSLVDILMQVVLHGQYHRGKINLMLRETGLEPAPVDFIAFARGVPAATTR